MEDLNKYKKCNIWNVKNICKSSRPIDHHQRPDSLALGGSAGRKKEEKRIRKNRELEKKKEQRIRKKEQRKNIEKGGYRLALPPNKMFKELQPSS